MTFGRRPESERADHSRLSKPGILFRDITTLLADARAFRRASTSWCIPGPATRSTRSPHRGARLHPGRRDRPSGLRRLRADPQEGQAAAHHGADRLFFGIRHRRDGDACRRIHPGERVILVDDLIATGGTAEGAGKAVAPDRRQCGRGLLHHRPAGSGCAAETARDDVPVRTLMAFEGTERLGRSLTPPIISTRRAPARPRRPRGIRVIQINLYRVFVADLIRLAEESCKSPRCDWACAPALPAAVERAVELSSSSVDNQPCIAISGAMRS